MDFLALNSRLVVHKDLMQSASRLTYEVFVNRFQLGAFTLLVSSSKFHKRIFFNHGR